MRIGCFVVAFLILTQLATADTIIRLTESREVVERGDRGVAADESQNKTASYQVTLGDRGYIVSVDNDQAAVEIHYDFERRRLYMLSHQRGIYSDSSLHSIAGFRAIEFQNRLAMGEALKKVIQDENDPKRLFGEPMVIEHQLSMVMPDRGVEGQFEIVNDRDQTRFVWNEIDFVTTSTEIHETDARTLSRFLTFLRLKCGVHPFILNELAKLDGIPHSIELFHLDPDPASLTFTVESAEEAPAITLEPPDELKRVEDFNESNAPLFERLAEARSLAGSEFPKHLDLLVKQTEEDALAGEHLRALLGFFEYQLMTGRFIGGFRELGIEPTDEGRALMTALTPEDATSARSALETLKRLAEESGDYAFIFLIYQGNIQQGFREYGEAEKLFLGALKGNPLLTGVWKDLGVTYYQQFQVVNAWRCWDLARTIVPDHPLLETVDQQEARLVESFPGYYDLDTFANDVD